MFDFDVGKLLIFGIVALAVIPPKDLPRVMRTIGQVIGKMRRTAAEFQGQFMDAMREADLDSVKKEFTALNDAATKEFAAISENATKEIEALNEAAKIDVAFDPAAAMRDEVTSAVHSADQIGASTVALEAPAAAAAHEAEAVAAAETPAPAPVEAAPVALEPASPPAVAEPFAAEEARVAKQSAAG